MPRGDDRLAAGLLALVVVALGAAGIAPYDRHVFALEVGPWVVLLATTAAFHRRYPMTPLSHIAIAGLCLLFVLGAHYTYTRVPPGLWLRDGREREPPVDRGRDADEDHPGDDLEHPHPAVGGVDPRHDEADGDAPEQHQRPPVVPRHGPYGTAPGRGDSAS